MCSNFHEHSFNRCRETCMLRKHVLPTPHATLLILVLRGQGKVTVLYRQLFCYSVWGKGTQKQSTDNSSQPRYKPPSTQSTQPHLTPGISWSRKDRKGRDCKEMGKEEKYWNIQWGPNLTRDSVTVSFAAAAAGGGFGVDTSSVSIGATLKHRITMVLP